jgi:MFS family permease
VDAPPSATGLWRQPGFLKLWLAGTLSWVGSEVTLVALPLAAVSLGASPVHMGVLRSAGYLSDLLVGPLAGAWVDRVRRRPLAVAADLGRAVLLGAVPVAALLGVLAIEHLLAVALLVGALGTLGTLAQRAFLVAVVPRPRLVEANSKLSASRSGAHVIGPGLGGALVQLLSAPVAIAVDAFSFATSALGIALIRGTESPSPSAPSRRSLLAEAREGLGFVLVDPILRRIALAVGVFALFDSAFFGLYVLYVTRELGVPPLALGVIFMLGGVGGVAGALIAGRVAARYGLGRAIVGGLLLAGIGDAVIPWAGAAPGLTVPLLGLAELVVTLGVSVFTVNELALRQRVTPDALQGRMHATFGVMIGGGNALGALGGGLLAELMGVRPLLLVAATATLAGGLWLLRTRVWTLKDTDRDGGTPPHGP